MHDHLYSHSRFGDNNYENREDCDWVIESSVETVAVQLSLLTFEVEDEQDCGYDYVEVYDGYDDSAIRLAKLCGTKVCYKTDFSLQYASIYCGLLYAR